MKYRLTSYVVDAFRLGEDGYPFWFMELCSNGKAKISGDFFDPVSAVVHTPGGKIIAQRGDYIVNRSPGEFCACTPEQFRAIYSEVG